MLQQALEPTAIPDESEEECGEEINAREKVVLIVTIGYYQTYIATSNSLNGRNCFWLYILIIWTTFFTSEI